MMLIISMKKSMDEVLAVLYRNKVMFLYRVLEVLEDVVLCHPN